MLIDPMGSPHITNCSTCAGTGWVIDWKTLDYTQPVSAKLIQCTDCNGSGKQVIYTIVTTTTPTSRTNGGVG